MVTRNDPSMRKFLVINFQVDSWITSKIYLQFFINNLSIRLDYKPIIFLPVWLAEEPYNSDKIKLQNICL